MKLTGMSRESADILGDVVGTDEYNAVPPVQTGEVEDGNFSEDSIATEDGNGDAGGVEGETSENTIEDQDDLDLTNADGGEYDSSEASTEDGDAVDTAFDAIGGGTDDISTDTGAVDPDGDGDDDSIPGGEGDTDADGGTGDVGDGDDTSVGSDNDISVDTGAVDTGTGDDTATGDDVTGAAPAEAPAEATDVPVETVDTDQSGLDADQVKEGAAAVESFFQVLDRRAARSFEDGADTILDEPEVANADIPVPEDDGTGDVGAGDTATTAAEVTGDGADVGGDTTDQGTEEVAETEIADLNDVDLGAESFNIF